MAMEAYGGCGAVKSHTARAMVALRTDLEQQDQARKPWLPSPQATCRWGT